MLTNLSLISMISKSSLHFSMIMQMNNCPNSISIQCHVSFEMRQLYLYLFVLGLYTNVGSTIVSKFIKNVRAQSDPV